MTHRDTDIEAIVAEIMRPEMKDGETRPHYAARLIATARRERDEARADWQAVCANMDGWRTQALDALARVRAEGAERDCNGVGCTCPDCPAEPCCYRQRKGFDGHSPNCRTRGGKGEP